MSVSRRPYDAEAQNAVPKNACPSFFYSHVAYQPPYSRTLPVAGWFWSPIVSVIKHSLFLSIQDYGFWDFFSRKSPECPHVYHDRITRLPPREMTKRRYNLREKNNGHLSCSLCLCEAQYQKRSVMSEFRVILFLEDFQYSFYCCYISCVCNYAKRF